MATSADAVPGMSDLLQLRNLEACVPGLEGRCGSPLRAQLEHLPQISMAVAAITRLGYHDRHLRDAGLGNHLSCNDVESRHPTIRASARHRAACRNVEHPGIGAIQFHDDCQLSRVSGSSEIPATTLASFSCTSEVAAPRGADAGVNNVRLTATANGGSFTDNIGKRGSGRYTYRVATRERRTVRTSSPSPSDPELTHERRQGG